ncbi:MAG: NAD(P)H-dependent glycerol-3-phosphate dehydrogenase [Flavobacteriales bacterium]|uniref:NAD(P)H-dependent glycerol-3-phosphate dehydrogenase n=1 Tax=Sanyastnella coralliicola TaxID=3069118 RepID=UPI0027B8BEBD|nr:NAD(P)H-dependent glycerol-3-phosphate dehydrogenase [Longitalea sp. SCSIO 12813]MCH2199603.1 NAD(P)H-dependent glycerol-3-phosphate dehydrogenase [Flavobacteriales bacterium]
MTENASRKKRVGVLGGGSWATAIVKMLSNNLDTVHWWMRSEQSADHLRKFGHNPKYIQSIAFDMEQVQVSTNMQEVIDASDILIIAIPSAFLDSAVKQYKPQGLDQKILFSAIKGVIVEYDSIPARYLHKEFRTPYEQIGIIAGPCHAEEVASEKLSYLTLACPNLDIAAEMAELLQCRYIKTSISEDVFGTEISAVLKNVYAVAAGICHGLGYGDNFQSVLIANAIQEIKRFVDAIHEVHRDVKSSAYLGDLLVTGYSPYSRNRTFGTMVGKGYSVKGAMMEMNMVAEGYYAARGIHVMNEKFKVDIPIAEAVYRILYEKISPVIEMRLLADRLS